jgi:hypothetical protein
MTPSMFDDLPAGPDGAERIPIERLTRRQLLAELDAASREASAWHARGADLAVVGWANRVQLLVQQMRVHLGARMP